MVQPPVWYLAKNPGNCKRRVDATVPLPRCQPLIAPDFPHTFSIIPDSPQDFLIIPLPSIIPDSHYACSIIPDYCYASSTIPIIPMPHHTRSLSTILWPPVVVCTIILHHVILPPGLHPPLWIIHAGALKKRGQSSS